MPPENDIDLSGDRGDNLDTAAVQTETLDADKLAEEAGLKAGAPAEDEPAKDEVAGEEKGEGKEKKKDSRIPLSRHEEILRKERERREALEAQLQQQNKAAQAQESDKFIQGREATLDELEAKYNKALIDGETKDAQALMKQIRATEREIVEHRTELRAQAAVEIATEQVRYDAVVSRLEAAYPQLVPGSDEFDRDTVAEILEMKEAYELKGYKPSQALQKAVGYIIKPENKKQEAATTSTPRVSDEAVAEKVREERKTEANKKAVDAIKGTPPSTAKSGVDSDKLGGGTLTADIVMKMSQSDFAKLSEKDLARLRGDEV